jgi:hypothetical protein
LVLLPNFPKKGDCWTKTGSGALSVQHWGECPS